MGHSQRGLYCRITGGARLRRGDERGGLSQQTSPLRPHPHYHHSSRRRATLPGSRMAEDHRAISGYAFMLYGGAVSWSAKKQEIVTLSTTESEYVAATHATKEALWLRSLITQIFGAMDGPMTLFSDNQSAIALSKECRYHTHTKHIDIRYHFIYWVIEDGSIRLIYCPTDNMVVDTLMKALPSTKVKHFAAALGLATV